ncbi:MAG: RsiV family protein [Muribaculaceae bacterium]|nr:RsiV family protein [Muribaculaceae bacterium]
MMFSFQPYEIDCWAAGAYHFIVPYKKLMPYLTSEAKRLISNLNSK